MAEVRQQRALKDERTPDLAAEFESRIQDYWNLLFRYLRGMVGDDAAEDLLMETLRKAWRAWPHYVEQGDLQAWLFSIARHVVFDNSRNARKRSFVAYSDQLGDWAGASEPDEEFFAGELLERVEQELGALPVEQREAFLLQFRVGFKGKEIAELTDAEHSTVRSRVQYAFNKLRAAARNEP